ncbi:hypothetical protein HBI56_111640 [Parastagonospora nodorum]|uniref:Uncharacterized protein n=1 Tax=Phaeosphaeria nodorum (strain SN15 / ATCC MYA-4574 / FGSC 10173) TaxID=321614 RepID=A0A7U2EVS0_PHANO|nr:hypothetical protein HBH56_044260 [Parastagonospora nodorum]QRC92778.1 hypothetical protein JI435_081650 [Parastagonospora nodorum SN15]KAH3932886.1 hypothetical protein HBH54_072010 [Parastagonospora nodorum]KAH3946339.1 hypothetical protein HBH53_131200 [Parastagonospora nodorum]KAH3973149.1 hypothetical protein HBH52_144080 [Parastagonospora nodorum]
MSAQQQQPAQGFNAASFSTSPASAIQTPTQAVLSARRSPEYTIGAPGPSSLDTIAPRSRLPRPISPPSVEHRTTYASAADRTHNRGYSKFGSPAGEPLPSQTDAFAASEYAVSRAPPPRSRRESTPGTYTYVPGYRSRPLPRDFRDANRSRRENRRRAEHGTSSSPRSENNYRARYAVESPLPRLRRDQKQIIPPWARKEVVKPASPQPEKPPEKKFEHPTRHPHWGGAAVASTKQQCTKPSEYPYYDAIIAGLNRTYNKPKPKAGSPPGPTKIPKPEQRAASPYRPVRSKVQKPTRPHDSQNYSTWSKDALLNEVNLRHLYHDSEDSSHLASILAMHDKEFLRKCLKLSNLKTSKDLRRYADRLNMVVSDHGVGQYQPLVEEMAEELARRTVSRHNEKARMLKKEPVPETKTKDLIPDKKIVKAGAKKIPAEASQKTASKSTTVTLKNILGLISKEVNPNDSGYSSPSRKPSSSPQERSLSDGDDNLQKPSVVADEKPTDSKKRSLPVEFKKETQASPKRNKITLENEMESRKKKAHRARNATATATATAGDDGEEMEVDSAQPAPVFVFGASAQAAEPTPAAKETVSAEEVESESDVAEEEEEEVIVAAPKTSQKRKSLTTEDDENAEQLPAKVAKHNPSRPVAARTKKAGKDKQSKELEGIPTEERIPGQVYVPLRDGSWKLSQSSRASKKPAESALKYIVK